MFPLRGLQRGHSGVFRKAAASISGPLIENQTFFALGALLWTNMPSKNETVHLRLEHRIAWVTLDRPPLNILDIPMTRALGAALKRALPKCDYLIFQGAGLKAFSAGADVADHTPGRVGNMLSAFHSVFRRLATSHCITIAAVHGCCLGGGMELAAFCDFVLATESAQFGQPEIKLGCFPPVAMIILPRLIGMPAAVENLLNELRSLSPAVLQLTRRTLWQLHFDEFARQLKEVELVYSSKLMKSGDAREGVRAFLEKRAPIWGKR